MCGTVTSSSAMGPHNVRMIHRFRVKIPAQDVELFLEEGSKFDIEIAKGIPSGSKMVGGKYDPATHELNLIFQHPDAMPLPQGSALPTLEIVPGFKLEPEESLDAEGEGDAK